MKKIEVIKYFGGLKKAADALGIWPQSIYQWGDDVPDLMAYKVQVITKGALKVKESGEGIR